MTKPPLPLGRAPRPRATPEQMAEVQNQTADLGFSRPSTAAAPRPEPVSPSKPAAPQVATVVDPEDEPTENLRIPVTKKIWDELTRTALDRRVTVRYLCLEALSKAGYDVDMSKVPADGRRIKKKGAQ